VDISASRGSRFAIGASSGLLYLADNGRACGYDPSEADATGAALLYCWDAVAAPQPPSYRGLPCARGPAGALACGDPAGGFSRLVECAGPPVWLLRDGAEVPARCREFTYRWVPA
jgi:hypothetical protein